MTYARDGRLLARGEVQTAPNTSPALCYPSCPGFQCERCTRYRPGQPMADRLVVVIDASTVRTGDRCEMFA